MIILQLPMILEENLEASVLRECAAKSGNPPIIFLGSDNDEETVGRVHAYIKRLRGKWAVAQTLAELGELPAPVATRITTMTDMTAGLIESTPPAPEPGIARNDLVPVARLAAWIFRPIAENKQITLTVDVPAAGLLAVCDEVRIQRVLENLLSNAIKHSPVGGTVTLAARAENGILRLWVDDEGPGLTADEQPSLFADSENSLDEQAAEEYEDDRGLLVCQQIAEMHQGEIEMSNRLEGGAHFELRLPTEYQPRFITAGAPADRATTENRLSFTSSAQPGLVSMNLPDPSAN
jgi:two-component sensor histidine kinase